MEAEYSTLSHTMHESLPFQHLVIMISDIIRLNAEAVPFKTMVWEDNSGALARTNMEPSRITP
jgi:hypothetical protein